MILADHFSQYEDGYLPVIAKTVSLKLHELIGEHIDLKQYVEPNNHKETLDMIFGILARYCGPMAVYKFIEEEFVSLFNHDISKANIPRRLH